MKSKLICFVLGIALMGLVFPNQILMSEEKTRHNDPINIGFEAPLTGPFRFPGKFTLDGIKLAISKINERGGILNREVKLFVFDDSCELDKTKHAWHDFFKINRVGIILGNFCEKTLSEAARLSTSEQKLLIPTGLGSAWLISKHKNPWTYSLSLGVRSQATALSDYLKKRNIDDIAIIFSEMPRSVFAMKAIWSEAQSKGISIKESVSVTPEMRLDSRIQSLKKINPKGIVIVSNLGEIDRVIQSSHEIGLKPRVWGTIVVDDPNFTESSIKKLEGVIFPNNFTYSTEKGKAFVSKFYNKYNYLPYFSAKAGYDLMYLLKTAIERMGDEHPDKLRKFFEYLTDGSELGDFVISPKENKFYYNDVYLVTPKTGALVVLADYRGIGKGRR